MGQKQGITGVIGSDTLIINGVVITGHADADAYKIEPQGPISEYKISKDGNTIIALKYSGVLCKMTVRLIRACPDDQFLNGLLQQFLGAPNKFPLMNGSYVKSTGDGKGGTTDEVYILGGGVFEAIPMGQSNMDGNIESGVSVYTLWFRNDARLFE
jgi:hypothetical protein